MASIYINNLTFKYIIKVIGPSEVQWLIIDDLELWVEDYYLVLLRTTTSYWLICLLSSQCTCRLLLLSRHHLFLLDLRDICSCYLLSEALFLDNFIISHHMKKVAQCHNSSKAVWNHTDLALSAVSIMPLISHRLYRDSRHRIIRCGACECQLQWLHQRLLCYSTVLIMTTNVGSVLLSPAFIVMTKYHRLGILWMIEIHFSQFWRLEVQDQGASMVRAEMARELWGISFVEALTPFIKLHVLIPSQRSHLLTPSQGASGLQHVILEGIHIQTIAPRVHRKMRINFWPCAICHLEFYSVNIKQHIFKPYLLLNCFFFFFLRTDVRISKVFFSFFLIGASLTYNNILVSDVQFSWTL